MTLNIATALTLLRILLIPILVVVFYLPHPSTHLIAAGVFLLAAITDAFDGWVARRFDQISRFGAFLDPVADKLMVAVTLVLLVQADPSPLMALLAAVIIGREITISALREWMAELGEQGRVRVGLLGKVKTIAQMTAMTMLLIREPLLGLPVYTMGLTLLGLAALLTLWSGLQYVRAAWPAMRRPA